MRKEKVDEIIDNMPEDVSLYGSLFTVANRIQAAGDKYLEDVTMRQQFLLSCLELFENSHPTLHELAHVFGSSYQNIKRIAKQLEAANYLEIRKDSFDRRKLRIILNEEKYNILKRKLEEGKNKFSEVLLDGVSPEEKIVLHKTLLKMESNLSNLEDKLEEF